MTPSTVRPRRDRRARWLTAGDLAAMVGLVDRPGPAVGHLATRPAGTSPAGADCPTVVAARLSALYR